MTKSNKIGILAFSAILVFVLLYDLVALVQGSLENTVSVAISNFSHEEPAFVAVVFFILGHLFWQMKRKIDLVKEIKEIITISPDTILIKMQDGGEYSICGGCTTGLQEINHKVKL